jgi:hypothetical protein
MEAEYRKRLYENYASNVQEQSEIVDIKKRTAGVEPIVFFCEAGCQKTNRQIFWK